jgi:hypothetical protein
VRVYASDCTSCTHAHIPHRPCSSRRRSALANEVVYACAGSEFCFSHTYPTCQALSPCAHTQHTPGERVCVCVCVCVWVLLSVSLARPHASFIMRASPSDDPPLLNRSSMLALWFLSILTHARHVVSTFTICVTHTPTPHTRVRVYVCACVCVCACVYVCECF